MNAKALPILITCLVVFLMGLTLLMRPHYEVEVLEVVDTYTRMKGFSSHNSSRRQSVKYANVKVEIDGVPYTVTVRDHPWVPIRPGDTVLVSRRLFGGLVEYRPDRIYTPTILAAVTGLVALALFLASGDRGKSP